jgi:hypothetical protein
LTEAQTLAPHTYRSGIRLKGAKTNAETYRRKRAMSSNEIEKAIGSFAAGALGVLVFSPLVMLLTLPLLIIRAWVFVIVWGWFMEPWFAQISMPVAIGFMILARLLHPTFDDSGKDHPHPWAALAGLYLQPFFALLIAYVAHFFV